MEGKPQEEKRSPKPNFLARLKDSAEDTEHNLELLGTFVRLGVVIWSGFI